MNSYEEKQERHRERLEARANRLRAESRAAYNQAHSMAEVIPFGQPILVGHHSEKRDRNYRGRIHSKFGQAFALDKEANEAAAKAASVGTGGISSDDPDAVEKLRTELAELEAKQVRMVAANKAVRANDDAALQALGYNAASIAALKQPDFCGRIGYPSYQLTNNGANIRRIKARIEQLSKAAERETKETLHPSGVRIVENAEANRLQLIFPGKPSAEIRTLLKQHGFRWSPMEGAWQRHLNSSATFALELILHKL